MKTPYYVQRVGKVKLLQGSSCVNNNESTVGSSLAAAETHVNIGDSYELKALRNIRGIIFDFDGTLFDNARFGLHLILAYPPDILRIWRERLVRKRFEGCDFSTPEKYYRAFFGVLAKACRLSPQILRNWYFKNYMPRMARILKKHYKFRQGVKELLERLYGPADSAWGLPSGVPAVSIYSDYPYLRERLSALGLTINPKLRLYGPDSFGAQKPASRPFRCIAQDMGIRPEETLVIGDRDDTDGRGAFNAGMRFLCLETGRRRYFKFDPYREYPQPVKPDEPRHKRSSRPAQQQLGPILPMYSARWEELVAYYRKRWSLTIE
jgi:FMN phosphatase YigB (HAD superfamily)